MKKNVVEEAMAKVAAAIDQVVEQGGVVHEASLWDAHEMALDGQPTKSIAERIKQERAEPYVPRGGWAAR